MICLSLGACASSLSDYNPFAKAGDLFSKSDSPTPASTRLEASRVLGAEDYIGADGSCAATANASTSAVDVTASTTGAAQGENPEAPAAAGAPGTPGEMMQPSGGIALGMTECEVARRAGAPEKVDLGADERGERSVVLTYMHGERAGIYRFREGRLFTIERVAVAEPEKPKKPVKPAKKTAAAPKPKPAKPKTKQAAKTDDTQWPAPPPPQSQAQSTQQAAPWPSPQQGQGTQTQAWPSPPPLRTN